jgi:hypothetical protein
MSVDSLYCHDEEAKDKLTDIETEIDSLNTTATSIDGKL